MNLNTLIVTGANGIIGTAVCNMALEKGYQVAALDVSFDNLEDLKNKYTDSLILLNCDLRILDNIKASKNIVLDQWGKIDGLFNNAAWKGDKLEKFFECFEDYSLETWRSILSVNLDAVMLVDQVFGSYMANSQGFGSIVHTASIYGIIAPDQRIYEGAEYLNSPINTPAVYSASKGAVIALTKYLAAYWANKGIRVNTVSPGGVESGQNFVFQQKYSAKVPLGRMALPNEIAAAALFLLSPQASYINGHNLIVDGGISIW